MRVPSYLLRQTAAVATYLGSGARGKRYADPVDVRCRLEAVSSTVRRPDGQEVTVSGRMFCFPEAIDVVKDESRVTHEGDAYTVAVVRKRFGRHRMSHLEVLLSAD